MNIYCSIIYTLWSQTFSGNKILDKKVLTEVIACKIVRLLDNTSYLLTDELRRE